MEQVETIKRGEVLQEEVEVVDTMVEVELVVKGVVRPTVLLDL